MITNTFTSSKQKISLLWLAPAALALLLYASFVAMPTQSRLGELQSQKTTAQKSAITRTDAETARQRLHQTQEAVQNLNRQTEEDRYLITSLGRSLRAPEARLETAQLVTEILQQFELSINNQTFESTPVLSKYMTELNGKIDAHCPESPLEFWEIEVAGEYKDMISFLREVRVSGMRTFPILVNMTASPDGFHTWTIVFVV